MSRLDDGVPHDSMSYGRKRLPSDAEYYRDCVGCAETFHLDDTVGDLLRCRNCLEWVCVDCRSTSDTDTDAVCNACLQRRNTP
jgi:hypothetical protein